jgi:hypothetical protein
MKTVVLDGICFRRQLGRPGTGAACHLHGSVWLKVDRVLIHHEPAQTIFAIVGRESDARLTMVDISKEWIYFH